VSAWTGALALAVAAGVVVGRFRSGVPDRRGDDEQLRAPRRRTGAHFEVVDAPDLVVDPDSIVRAG
jgi:hypothetical protein